MELKKYIKRMFKPSVTKRAKAMKRARKARIGMLGDIHLRGDYQKLEKNLGYEFSDMELLKESLTHPGLVGVSKVKVKSNQRLEFLGDAILQAIITETVFRKFSDVDEGELTKIRIAFTQGSFLSQLSSDLEIPKFLILPKGAENIREIPSAAEDAIEAVIGAIYLDSNFETAKSAVLSWYKRKFENAPELIDSQNPKGHLQEMAARKGQKVEYALLSADDMSLRLMGEPGARRAVFCVMSDTNRTYSFLHAVMMWQAVDLLCDRALEAHGGSLPTPVSFLLDEFANIGRMPDVEKSIAVVRSRNMSISPVVQSMSQLKAAYGDAAQTIVDCCDTLLFLGGKSTETAREIAESVGKETVTALTLNETRGASRSSTSNYQRAERDLIQAAEVARLDRRRAVVLIAGARPFLDDKYDPARDGRSRRGGRG